MHSRLQRLSSSTVHYLLQLRRPDAQEVGTLHMAEKSTAGDTEVEDDSEAWPCLIAQSPSEDRSTDDKILSAKSCDHRFCSRLHRRHGMTIVYSGNGVESDEKVGRSVAALPYKADKQSPTTPTEAAGRPQSEKRSKTT